MTFTRSLTKTEQTSKTCEELMTSREWQDRFLRGVAAATGTELASWSKFTVEGKGPYDTRFSFSYMRPDCKLVVFNLTDRSVNQRFKAYVCIPRFQFFSAYSLAQLQKGPEEEKAPDCAYFGYSAIQKSAERVGKDIGRRLIAPTLAGWDLVIAKLEEEAAITSGRDKAIQALRDSGWKVKEGPSGSTYATKPGCAELVVNELGSVKLYYQNQSRPVDTMMRVAELLG